MVLDEIIDRLYGLPLSEFTRERDRAARELRSEGRRAEADELKALRKPTAAAGAINRLVREHAADVRAFLTAAGELHRPGAATATGAISGPRPTVSANCSRSLCPAGARRFGRAFRLPPSTKTPRGNSFTVDSRRNWSRGASERYLPTQN